MPFQTERCFGNINEKRREPRKLVGNKSRWVKLPSHASASFRNVVDIPHNLAHGSGEQEADAEQRTQGDGFSSLDLLPITHGISVRNHILLAVARTLPQFPDAHSQAFEEFGFISHGMFVSDLAYKDHDLFDTWYNWAQGRDVFLRCTSLTHRDATGGRMSHRIIEYKEAAGKTIEKVTLTNEPEFRAVTIRFSDKTALHFSVNTRVDFDAELLDWQTGNGQLIKSYQRVFQSK